MLEDLKTILEMRTGKQYEDSQLEPMIEFAKSIINSPITEVTSRTEYYVLEADNSYMTDYYPIFEIDSATVGDETVVVQQVDSEAGIIEFDKAYTGKLELEYKVGLPTQTLNSYLLPIVVEVVVGMENNGNLSSIQEGDVNVSYDTSSNTSMKLDSLIANLRGMYGAKVKLL